MAAITKNVFSNQFSISFPIMSCYLLKMTKILYSNLESNTRVSSTLLEFGVRHANIPAKELLQD